MSKPKKLNLNHATGAGLAIIADLVIKSRIRDRVGGEEQTRVYIEEELAPSIAEHGLISPIAVKQLPDGKLELVAGECRVKSFQYLGLTEIPYVFWKADSISPDEQRALELIENTRRRNMRWQDRVLAIYDIHTIKAKLNAKDLKSWGKNDTGELVGMKAQPVGDALHIAKLMLENDQEILNATSFDAAMKICDSRWEAEASAELKRRQDALPKKKKKPEVVLQPAQVTAQDLASKAVVVKTPVTGQPLAVLSSKKPAVEIDLSEKLFNGCCLEWFKTAEPEQFDLTYTDIPFGIDMANLAEQDGIELVRDSHGIDENVSLMKPFLEGIFKVQKDKTYAAVWYDIKHQEKLCDWAKDVGFEVQPYPLLWLKPSMKTKAAHCYWPKACEYILILRKGKATLRELQVINYKIAEGSVERRMQNNKFAKPFDISEWILKQISIPGHRMLDCYAGGGSLLRAGAMLSLDVFGIEKDSRQFPDLVETMKKVYNQIYHNNVNFT